jgi:uncharacterized protein (DUF2147 family)
MRTRPSYRCAILALVLLLGMAFADENENLILGDWLTQEKDGVIQIYRTEAGHYEGRVIGGSGDANRQDVNNPDPNLRSRPLVGQVVLRGFKYDGEGKWSGGTIYDPNNGKTYKCYVEVIDSGRRLKLRGYIGFSLLGRTQYWERVDKPQES